jgi:hypothetical protein
MWAGLLGRSDPEVLAKARELDRIIFTHDIRTMPGHFFAMPTILTPRERLPGVIWVAQEYPIGQAIDELEEIWAASAHEEWANRFIYLPL